MQFTGQWYGMQVAGSEEAGTGREQRLKHNIMQKGSDTRRTMRSVSLDPRRTMHDA